MDPPTLMNDGPYNLEEIWHFPMNGNGRGQFDESSRDVSGNDPVGLEQRMGHGGRKRRDVEEDSGKGVSTSNANASNNGVNDYDGKRIKALGSRDENCDSKAEAEPTSGKSVEQNTQPPEPSKQDYIHVRARRGQATDSHSLAERARREKISDLARELARKLLIILITDYEELGDTLFDDNEMVDYESDDEDETESSVDLFIRFLQSMFKKLSKRAKKASRFMLPSVISPQLVSFAVDGILLLAVLSILKALLEDKTEN